MWSLVWLLSFFSIYPLFVNKYCVMVVDGTSLSCWGKSRDIVGNALTSIPPESFPLSPLLYTLVHLYCSVDLLLEAIRYPVKRSK